MDEQFVDKADAWDAISEKNARITALEAENAKLKAALKPFADLAGETVDAIPCEEAWQNAATVLKPEPTNADLDAIAPF